LQLSVIIEDDRLITHCERTAEKTIIIKKEDAIRYGLVKAPIIFHDDNNAKLEGGGADLLQPPRAYYNWQRGAQW
jgi:hypothetical protein